MGTRLARNSLHSASGRVVAMLAWLVLTPPLVHALGPEGFGVWSLFYALSGWLGAMDLGFSQVALRFGAAARSRSSGAESGEYATLAVVGYLVLGAVWLGLVLLWKDPALDLLRITGGARVLTAQAFVAGAFVFTASGIANTTSAALQAWDRLRPGQRRHADRLARTGGIPRLGPGEPRGAHRVPDRGQRRLGRGRRGRACCCSRGACPRSAGVRRPPRGGGSQRRSRTDCRSRPRTPWAWPISRSASS
jgi:hypothetical protein